MQGNEEERAIRQICLKLTPPLLLSTPSRWRAVEDEDQLANSAGISAKDRVIQNAKVATDWIEVEVPKQLEYLKKQLEGIEIANLSIELRTLIAITLTRFISYRKSAFQPFSINVWTSSERNLFASPKNDEIARTIVRLHMSSEGNHTIPLDVIDVILQSYIRPLFSTTPSSRINETSGRTKQASKIQSAGAGPREDETIWKGGDLKRAKEMKCVGEEMLHTEEGSISLQSRHMGIGAESILFACCESIEGASIQDGDKWDRYWTQILPPLLQLLEDPSPRFRLAGTQILSATLLAGYEDPKRRQKIGTLLLRTGVAELFRSTLLSNLTFISVQISGALLQSTAEAYVKLVRTTTEDLIARHDRPQAYLVSDGGRARFEQFSQLIEDGVLRVWAYAPSTSTLFEIGEIEQFQDRLGGSEYEDFDVIDASIHILKQAAHSDNLGSGIMRYLDVTLEFLLQQLSGLEAKVERSIQKKLSDTKKESFINLRRQIVAAEAILSILQASSDCPLVEDWGAKCITTCAKCWYVCQIHVLKGAHLARLEELIHSLVQFFYQNYKASSDETLQTISKLDPSAFNGFLNSHA
ncbi:hypothetical protein L7F22_043816 [Adiantum nelumboides]|nr:hypothetical protein [Adiantum nelumboides]